MKFKCPACKKIFTRDMRKTAEKSFMTKRGYYSGCDKTGENHYCKLIT